MMRAEDLVNGGLYRLTRDVRNTARDKRKKYGMDISSAPEVIPKGACFVALIDERENEIAGVRIVRSDIRLKQLTGGDARLRGVLHQGVVTWHVEREKEGSAVIDEIVEALESSEWTIEATIGEYDSYQHAGGWAAIRKLIDDGVITLAQVRDALRRGYDEE